MKRTDTMIRHRYSTGIGVDRHQDDAAVRWRRIGLSARHARGAWMHWMEGEDTASRGDGTLAKAKRYLLFM